MNFTKEKENRETMVEETDRGTKEKVATATLAYHLSAEGSAGLKEMLAMSGLSMYLNSSSDSISEKVALAALTMYLENSGRKITCVEAAIIYLTLYMGREEFERNAVSVNRPVYAQTSQWNSKILLMRQIPQRIPGHHPYAGYKRF